MLVIWVYAEINSDVWVKTVCFKRKRKNPVSSEEAQLMMLQLLCFTCECTVVFCV